MSMTTLRKRSPKVQRTYQTKSRNSVFMDHMSEIQLEPHGQSKVSLGVFTSTSSIKGFSVEISPDPESSESVVTQLTNLGTPKRYELVLHIVNYGDKPLTANIWQL